MPLKPISTFGGCVCFTVLLLCQGCGPSGPETFQISGKVTLKEKPVAKGTVTFEDASVGFAATADLQPDGKYSVKLVKGNYRVMLLPLFEDRIAADGTTVSMPVDPKSVPQKYQSTTSSGLKLEVTKDSVFDIPLQ